jgi:hypothetical protein
VRAAASTAVILRNFNNMTRLPRVLFEANPHLVWLSANSDVKQGANWETGGVRASDSGLSRDMVNPRTVVTPVWHPHKRGRSERAATSAALPCKLGRPVLARRSVIQRWPVDDRDTLPNSAQVSAVKLHLDRNRVLLPLRTKRCCAGTEAARLRSEHDGCRSGAPAWSASSANCER